VVGQYAHASPKTNRREDSEHVSLGEAPLLKTVNCCGWAGELSMRQLVEGQPINQKKGVRCSVSYHERSRGSRL